MAANTQPIFPEAPILGIATLTAPGAVLSRANIVGVTGLTSLTTATTDGLRVDAITVKGKATNALSILSVWINDGTNSYLFDEIDLPATTAGATADSISVTKQYSNLILPPTYRLYVSVTVSADLNVFAHGGSY